MALDRLALPQLDDGQLDVARPTQIVPGAEPEPIPVSTAPIPTEPIAAPQPAPESEPWSWDRIWRSMGATPPAQDEQAVIPLGPRASGGAPASMPTGAPTGASGGEIDNSSRESFVRTAFPYMLEAAGGNQDAAEMMLAAAISENGAVGTGKPFFANNFFGIKGKGDAGSASAATWEQTPNGPVNITDDFAAYSSPVAGFRAFFDFLQQNARYANALAAYNQTGDAETLFQGINQAGYATDPNWAAKVAAIRRNQVAPVVAGLGPVAARPTQAAPLDIMDIASRYAGGTYVFGGGRDGQGYGVPGETSSDCSAFVSSVFAERGIPLIAHTDSAYAQLVQLGASQVPSAEAKPGDIVFFMDAGSGGSVTYHMGLYAGRDADGNPLILDQSTFNGESGVKLRPLNHAGHDIVILRDPRMDGSAASTMARPPRITPSGQAEGAMWSPETIPNRTAPESALEKLNRLTETARAMMAEASGSARDAADQAVGTLRTGLANPFMGPLANMAVSDDPLQVDRARTLPEAFQRQFETGDLPGGRALPGLAQGVGAAFGFVDPFEGVDPNDPLQQAIGPYLQDYRNSARSSTVGMLKGLIGFAGGAVDAAGFDDSSLSNAFESSRAYFEELQKRDPDFTPKQVAYFDPSSYTDPSTYATIAGQLIPSVLASMASGGMTAAALGKTAAAPLIAALPQLGTRASALGSAAFTLPTAAGETIPELRKLGATPQEAFVGGVISGALQSALEMVNPVEHSAGAVGKLLTGGSAAGRSLLRRILGAAKELVGNAIKEGFEEGAQQFADNVVQKWFGSDKGWFDQVFESAIGGFIGGGGMAAPGALRSTIAPGSPAPQQPPPEAPTGPQAPRPTTAPQDLQEALAAGIEPVARDRPNEGPGRAEAIGQTLPLPAHRIGETITTEYPTEGATALQPQRSNMQRPVFNDLPEDTEVDGYRVVGGPMRHGEDTSDLIEGGAVIPGTDVAIRGQRGETDQAFLDEIASRPYVAPLTSIIRQVHDRMQQHLGSITALGDSKPSVFAEWLLGPNLLGSNAQNPNADHNRIGIGVHEILHESILEAKEKGVTVGTEEFLRIVAKQTLSTLAHEIVHNKYPDPSHKDSRRHALTEMLEASAANPTAIGVVTTAFGRALGDTGLRSWHDDYIRIREMARNGPNRIDRPAAGGLPGLDEGRHGDSGQRGRPANGPGLGAIAPGARDRPDVDVGAGTAVQASGPQLARTDGVPPLDDEELSALLNDYFLETNPKTGDPAEAQRLKIELQRVLTAANVDQAISVAAVDFINADGGRVDYEAAQDQLRGRLRQQMPELFGGKPSGQPKHDYQSTQFDLPSDVAKRILNLNRGFITKAMLKDADSREQNPHLTLLYGLDDEVLPGDVADLIEDLPPITITIGEADVFEQDDQDVVMLRVDSPDLRQLRQTIEALPSSGNQHPSYEPHLTLAVVGKGRGRAIADRINASKAMAKLRGTEVTLSELSFSDRDGEKVSIDLSGAPATITNNSSSAGGGWTRTGSESANPTDSTIGGVASALGTAAQLGAAEIAATRDNNLEDPTRDHEGPAPLATTQMGNGTASTTSTTTSGAVERPSTGPSSGTVESANARPRGAEPLPQSSSASSGLPSEGIGASSAASDAAELTGSWVDPNGTTGSTDASSADLKTSSSPSSTSTTSSRSATAGQTTSTTSRSSAPTATDGRPSTPGSNESNQPAPGTPGTGRFVEGVDEAEAQDSESATTAELPDRGIIPGLGGLNLDRVPPAFRKILERKLTAEAKAGKEYQHGVSDLDIRRAAEAAGYRPDDPSYEANVETLAREIVGRDTAGRSVEIEALKRAIIEGMLEQFDGLADLNARMDREGATPELLHEAEAHVQRIVDQHDLHLLALRRSGEESGRALRRMQLGLADAAEMETLRRYNALVKQLDPVRKAVEAKVKAITEGRADASGLELSLIVRNLQALEKLGALSDFRIKTDGGYLPISTLSPEQMAGMSRDDVMRAMSAASRAWYEERKRLQAQQSGETRLSQAAGGPDDGPDLAYLLGVNLVAEQRAHDDPSTREQLAAERAKLLEQIFQPILDAETEARTQRDARPSAVMDPEKVRAEVRAILGERLERQTAARARTQARAGEAIGPIAAEVRDYRNAENMTLAASTAAAAHLGRILARLEQRIGDMPGGSGVVDLLRARFEAAVEDLALHPEAAGHVAQVHAAYERVADGEGQRFVDAALRVLGGETYVGDARIDPDQIATLTAPPVRRDLSRRISAVLTTPDNLDARRELEQGLGHLRAQYGAEGVRLADDLASLVAMEDARRIANGAIDMARADPTNRETMRMARATIEQVRALADATREPWLYQRFAPIAYTLEERLDLAVERALEQAAGKEARTLLKQIIADPGNREAPIALNEILQRTDPETRTALQEMLGVHLNPTLRGAAAAGADPNATEAQQQSAAARLIAKLQELQQIGRESNNPNIVRPLADEILGMLDALGAYGQEQAKQQRAKLQAAELTRLRMKNADVSQERWAAFSKIVADGDPAAIGRALRLVQDPSFASYVKEWGLIAMLSSPTTWGLFGTNSIGNLMNAGYMGVKWLPELGYDMAASALTGREREIFASEMVPALQAGWGGVKPGLAEAWDIWWRGGASPIDTALDRTLDNPEIQALRTEWLTTTGNPAVDFLGRWLHRFSTRPLAALDAFWSHTLYAANLEARLQRYAARTPGVTRASIDLLDHPEIVREAGRLTEYTLLQSKSKTLAQLGHTLDMKAGQKLQASPAGRILLELGDILQFLIVPFKSVPLNFVKQGLDRTVMLPWHLYRLGEVGLQADRIAADRAAEHINKKLPKDQRVLTGGDVLTRGRAGYRDELSQVRDEQAQRFGKLAMGTGLLLLGVMEALAGHLVGDDPDDEDDRLNWRAKHREQRVWNPGGLFERGFNYDNTPLAFPFAIAATAIERTTKDYKRMVRDGATPGTQTQAKALGTSVGYGALSAASHNFFLENLYELARGALDNRGDPVKTGVTFATDATGRQVPNVLTLVARLGDDYERETKVDGAWDTFVNQAVTQRIPSLRQGLEPKLGPLGQPEPSRYADDAGIPFLPLIPGITSWPSQTKERYSSTAAILGKYDLGIPAPPETITPRGGLPIELTAEEKRIYLQAMGPELANRTVSTYNRFADPRYVAQNRSILGASPQQSNRFVERRALQRYAISAAQQYGMAAVINSLGADKRERAQALRGRMLEEFQRNQFEPDGED